MARACRSFVYDHHDGGQLCAGRAFLSFLLSYLCFPPNYPTLPSESCSRNPARNISKSRVDSVRLHCGAYTHPPTSWLTARLRTQVSTDQWLMTHVDPSWPISTLKAHLLRRFDPAHPRRIQVSPRRRRRRSLSPITFAAPRSQKSAGKQREEEDEEEQERCYQWDEEEEMEEINLAEALAEAHR